ncbi:MAG: glycosyltransferase family 4 protein [bacterium]|nr:glycosyltransferase family 4 protein [bacterium]
MISTRFAGLDGVSMEAAKLTPVIEQAGHEISWLAGELGPGFTPGVEVPALHFLDEDNLALEARAFASANADPTVAGEVRWRASSLKPAIRSFLEQIDVAYAHNVLSIPMQLPFAMALTEALEETGVRAVGHHHDFGWEKPRFAHCTVPQILSNYFPPALERMRHGVINSLAQRALAERTGIEATVLPNILDFERGPSRSVDGREYRRAASIEEGTIVLLQPTRILERKGIESTLRLAAGLGSRAVVAFSHAADRDVGYWQRLQQLAKELDVRMVYRPAASESADESPWLGDAFAAADLVCFPSIQEGFGNALVEALFFKRPIFVNRYEVYMADIAPMGVQAVEMDGEVTTDVVNEVRALLDSPDAAAAMVEANYEVGLEHMSHQVMRDRLLPLLEGRD